MREALEIFVINASGTESQGHIRPLHFHVACRLVIEGGFPPGDITPHPPFRVEELKGGRKVLHYDEAAAGTGERTILGGLKTKDVDVVVAKQGIGPVLAVSMKGTLKAFRNLTNRMEEAVGDCTNLHITYPALVYGFLQVLRGTSAGSGVAPNDVCIDANGAVVDAIARYHEVMSRLEGRADLREGPTKYEAVALALVKPDEPGRGTILSRFPPGGSPLTLATFFEKLYRAHDMRFVYAAPSLESVTARLSWDESSPALKDDRARDCTPRIAAGEAD
jgi:hypothetical protein